MNLNELMNITCTDTIVKIDGIDSIRNKKELMVLNCKNKYNRIDLTKWNEILEKYGENRVIHQYTENNILGILIKL